MDDKQRIALVETRTRVTSRVRRRNSSATSSATTSARPVWSWMIRRRSFPTRSTTPTAARRIRRCGAQTEVSRSATGIRARSGMRRAGCTTTGRGIMRRGWAVGKRDPAGLVDGTNLFRYASDDPVDLTDPEGTQPRLPPPPPPPPPVPAPRQTPFNLVSDSPALTNWQRATNEVLETRFRGGSLPKTSVALSNTCAACRKARAGVPEPIETTQGVSTMRYAPALSPRSRDPVICL